MYVGDRYPKSLVQGGGGDTHETVNNFFFFQLLALHFHSFLAPYMQFPNIERFYEIFYDKNVMVIIIFSPISIEINRSKNIQITKVKIARVA